MKLKDIADMKDYLETRCYNPHEIYDLTGFFYNLFYPNTECEILASGNMGAIHGTFVITNSEPIGNCKSEEQIIYIEITDGRVISCVRVDNTQNNRDQIQKFMNGEIDKMSINEYEDGATQRALEELLGIADMVCY